VGATVIAVFALTGLVFFLSQYFQNVLGYSPLQAGLRELPLGAAGVLVIALIGPAVRWLGLGRAIALGLLVSAGGLTIVGFSAQYGAIAVALVVVGAGVGLALTLTTDAVVSAVPADRAGAASAVSETAYELGAALGIAVLGTVLSAWTRAGTFTEAMQGTALVSAALLALASFVAHRLIPSPVEQRSEKVVSR
jgi:DHA2 family multidrug resistance protein-like MFS transporter